MAVLSTLPNATYETLPRASRGERRAWRNGVCPPPPPGNWDPPLLCLHGQQRDGMESSSDHCKCYLFIVIVGVQRVSRSGLRPKRQLRPLTQALTIVSSVPSDRGPATDGRINQSTTSSGQAATLLAHWQENSTYFTFTSNSHKIKSISDTLKIYVNLKWPKSRNIYFKIKISKLQTTFLPF